MKSFVIYFITVFALGVSCLVADPSSRDWNKRHVGVASHQIEKLESEIFDEIKAKDKKRSTEPDYETGEMAYSDIDDTYQFLNEPDQLSSFHDSEILSLGEDDPYVAGLFDKSGAKTTPQKTPTPVNRQIVVDH